LIRVEVIFGSKLISRRDEKQGDADDKIVAEGHFDEPDHR
jgi:hypothetical protein